MLPLPRERPSSTSSLLPPPLKSSVLPFQKYGCVNRRSLTESWPEGPPALVILASNIPYLMQDFLLLFVSFKKASCCFNNQPLQTQGTSWMRFCSHLQTIQLPWSPGNECADGFSVIVWEVRFSSWSLNLQLHIYIASHIHTYRQFRAFT